MIRHEESIPSGSCVELRGGGAGLVVAVTEPVPRILHWGVDLGGLGDDELSALMITDEPAILNNAPDVPRRFSVWPSESEGWSGTPAHSGHRDGHYTSPRPRLAGATLLRSSEGQELTIDLDDPGSELTIRLSYRMTMSGLLTVDFSITRPTGATTRAGDAPYDLHAAIGLLPLPNRAGELLDFTGKWSRERSPQRRVIDHGSWSRETRRGKTGHDSPYVMIAGTPGFGFRSGEVWAVHLSWSGNQRYLLERLPEAAGVHTSYLGAAELLMPGEIRLAPGDSYSSPTSYFGWSDQGLDGLADRFHHHLRARPAHPAKPRPLILNTWEAVYFDHDPDRLRRLADLAAEIGVERVVLDDGWFAGRRDDRSGLGDWTVDPQVWPAGLGPFAAHVHSLGMEFGLWFEPEMINLDSGLARDHPDWVLGPFEDPGPEFRHQYVVDLTRADAWEYLLKQVDQLIAEYRIDYLKWDHNRDLLQAVSAGRPAVHNQTLALYRLLDAIKERRPTVEIETCAGGGGRIDLGILQRTDRVWASDCNDPVERQQIQRWTGQLLPPELVGSHLGADRSHTTSRITDLSFRLATALFSHPGIEADLTRLNRSDLKTVTAWAALYKDVRTLIHTGRVVRADLQGDDQLLHGVVADDGSAAIYCWARLATAAAGQPGRIPLPGLPEDRRYRIRIRSEIGSARRHEAGAAGWIDRATSDGLVISGTLLGHVGIPLPNLNPQQAMLLELQEA